MCVCVGGGGIKKWVRSETGEIKKRCGDEKGR